MKRLLVLGLLLLFPALSMAGGGFGTSFTKLSLTADDSTSNIDMRGYTQIGVEVIFATCTGAAADTGAVYIQTSNDGVNWKSIVTVVSDSGAGLTGDIYFNYIPDYATAGDGGVGRYVRIYYDEVTGAPNISFNVYCEIKE